MKNKKKILIIMIIFCIVLLAIKKVHNEFKYKTAYHFNPFVDKSKGYFKQVASMHYGRFKPVAVLLKNGDVLIFNSIYAEIYKTKENKFIKVNSNPNKFFNTPSAFLLSNGKVLIMGCAIINRKPQNSIEIFDSSTNLFYKEKKLENLLPYAPFTDIAFSQSKSGNNDKLYIIHGKENLIYDLSSNSFTTLPKCIIQRVYPMIIPINEQKFLILGGRSSSQKNSKYILKTEIFDTVTNKFSLGPVFPEFNGHIKFVTLKNNKILIFNNNKAIIYDSTKNNFHNVGNLIKQQRNDFACILLKNGKVLIVGGVDGYKDSSKGILETEIFDPESETFSIGPKLLYPRKNHQLALLNDGNVLVVGGEEELNPLNIFTIFNTDVELQKRAEVYIPSKQ